MRILFFLLSTIMVILTFTACTNSIKKTKDEKEIKREELKEEKIEKEEIKKEEAIKKEIIKEKTIDKKAELKQKVLDLLNKEEYLQAINLINKEGNKKNPSETYLGKEYIIAINELTKSGEKSFQEKAYEQAGIIFRKVLENYPTEISLQTKVRRPPEVIESYIGICSEELMDQGLLEYREGNLPNAIDTWNKILLFNPDYPDAKKAIETTTTQMENIRSIESPK